jgi:hypothetical protein
MNTVYLDAGNDDAERRTDLYRGQIHLITPRPSTLALVEWAQSLIEEAFAPVDPLRAQYSMPVQRFVDIFGPLKPTFIHHPHTKELVRAMMRDLGCDEDETYVDVPRLRGVTSGGYLTAGVGYAHPLHRDTWWSAPLQQLNWWLPIYPFESSSSMAFHPAYWDKHVANTSSDFDYYTWNQVGRADAAKHVTKDTREQPHIVQVPAPDPDPQVRFVIPPGGIIVFSGQHLHSTVANTSGIARFSIDLRTVNIADVEAGRGAVNADSAPSGTSLRDFRRLSDDTDMPERLALMIDPREIDPAIAVYKPADVVQTA